MQTQLKTVESQSKIRFNNDPLAHIDVLQSTYNGALAEHRIHTEFLTDMGERLRQPFNYDFKYQFINNELVSDTGMSLTGLLADGYEAAKQDVLNGSQVQYHADRAEALMGQQSIIRQWYESGGQNNLLLASLCPPATELDIAQSKKQAFKPDRAMASLQLFSKSENGTIDMQAFSIDNLDLTGLGAITYKLGGVAEIADNTLDQLLQPIILHKDVDAKKFIDTNDEQMRLSSAGGSFFVQGMDEVKYRAEANTFVESKPETWDLYLSIVKEVATSLKLGAVNGELSIICTEKLAPAFVANKRLIPDFLRISVGETYSEDLARALMKYLINQAIPEYLLSEMEQSKEFIINDSDTGSYGIAEAGVSAVQSGNNHEGSCPTSTSSNTSVASSLNGEQKALSRVYNTIQFKPKAIISKGEFEMLPIGSCPVCGSECGTGIRNRTSGNWYCTQDNCRAFNKDIYDFVLGINNKDSSPKQKDSHKANDKYKPKDNKEYIKHIIDIEISLVQKQISQLSEERYTAGLSQEERSSIIKMLIEKDIEKKVLLRASLGDVASVNALDLELAA